MVPFRPSARGVRPLGARVWKIGAMLRRFVGRGARPPASPWPRPRPPPPWPCVGGGWPSLAGASGGQGADGAATEARLAAASTGARPAYRPVRPDARPQAYAGGALPYGDAQLGSPTQGSLGWTAS